MYLPRALHAMSRVAPKVRLRFVAMPQSDLYSALYEGQVDLAIGYFPDLQGSEFVRRKISQHGFARICSSVSVRVLRDADGCTDADTGPARKPANKWLRSAALSGIPRIASENAQSLMPAVVITFAQRRSSACA
jgi:DNA-binding transcriptional LysR family regulator